MNLTYNVKRRTSTDMADASSRFAQFGKVFILSLGVLFLSLGLTFSAPTGGIVLARLGGIASAALLLYGLVALFSVLRSSTPGQRVAVIACACLDLALLGFIGWIFVVSIRVAK